MRHSPYLCSTLDESLPRRAHASTSPTPARLTASRLRRSNMTLYRDKAIRRHGHRVYAAIDKKLGKLGMVARRLAAQPDLCARLMRFRDDRLDHPFHRVVLFVEQVGKRRGITIDAQHQLRQVVASNGEAIEPLGERRRQNDVGG